MAKDYNSLIVEKEAELKRLKQEKENYNWQKENQPTILLAEELHEAFCRWNHTDGCGWYYQDESKRDRGEYLRVAQVLLARYTFKEARELVSLFRNLR